MAKYVYPAVFTPENDYFLVNFPDIENCFTDGKDLADAIEMGADALALMLCDYERHGKPVPKASPIESIKTEKGSFVKEILPSEILASYLDLNR